MSSRPTKMQCVTLDTRAGPGKVERKLNDSLYELYHPDDTPTMEVLFFHGFQRGDYKDAHMSTWKTGDGSCVWPQVWLAEQFPNARILSVDYNASELQRRNTTFDMSIIGENVTSNLLDANIGQEPCRPVIFVGHSFGGLVIKQLCVYAAERRGLLDRTKKRSLQLNSLLDNVKGMFFYSTPHRGISEGIAELFVAPGPLLEYVKTLNTQAARVDAKFHNLSGQSGPYPTWQIEGLGESCPTDLGGSNNIIVEEASSRCGTWFTVVKEADHISVCRPTEKISRSFSALTQFIKDIAIPSQSMVHGLADNSTALERRAYEVQVMLGSSAVLGVVGMGGVGKTSIAKEVFNNISGQFVYTLFVDNVKGIEPYKLNDWLLNQFRRGGNQIANTQWSDLNGKKTLIVLDDVDNATQFRNLPKLDQFGAGSKLIVTSRNADILTFFAGSVKHQVKFLDPDEAEKLFCHHAFNEEGIPKKLLEINHHLEKVVKKVIEKCDGLPLTLEIMGCYLRGKETNRTAWEQAIKKLADAEPVGGDRKSDRLWASLTLSYDALCENERNMFIDAATYFFEQPVEVAVAAWSTAYETSDISWTNLLSTCMVKEVGARNKFSTSFHNFGGKKVWVHEQLRDLAKSFSKGIVAEIHVNGGAAVDLPNANTSQNQVSQETRILQLRGSSSILQPGTVQLEMLDKLKYLDVYDVVTGRPSNNTPTKLSLLKWNARNRHTALLPVRLQEMKKLAFLRLENVEIPQDSLAALGNLSNLRILALSVIQNLNCLPENLGNLSQLKHLHLKKLDIAELPESFGNLSSLTTFKVHHCRRLTSFPNSFGHLRSLTHLSVFDCVSLQMVPASFGSLSSLGVLKLRCTGLKTFPESSGELKALKKLEIASAQHLDALPESFGKLTALIDLKVYNCGALQLLPGSFGRLLSLENLALNRCTRLKTLPESFGELKALKKLEIQDAKHLEALPESFGILTALTDLTIYHCGALHFLLGSFGRLSSLENLELDQCTGLKTLPESFGELKALKKLEIAGAQHLEALPESFGKLTALTDLKVYNCGALQLLPGSFGRLLSLENLALNQCTRLKTIPESFGELKALKKLEIGDAKHLEALPESFGKLTALIDVNVYNCGDLQLLPGSFGRLSSLGNLKLRQCTGLKTLPESFGELKALKKLRIWGARHLEALPESFGNLTALTDLLLDYCGALQLLPGSFGRLSSLEELNLSLMGLKTLPESFGELKALKKLEIGDAQHLEALPESFGKLTALIDLKVYNCGDLQLLPGSFGQLSSLEKLALKKMGLKTLPESFGELKALKKLIISDAEHLEALPESFGNLTALRDLEISYCGALEFLPGSCGRLSSVKKLTLKECTGLKTLPECLGELKALEEVKLEALPDSFGNVAALAHLKLGNCRAPESPGESRFGYEDSEFDSSESSC